MPQRRRCTQEEFNGVDGRRGKILVRTVAGADLVQLVAAERQGCTLAEPFGKANGPGCIRCWSKDGEVGLSQPSDGVRRPRGAAAKLANLLSEAWIEFFSTLGTQRRYGDTGECSVSPRGISAQFARTTSQASYVVQARGIVEQAFLTGTIDFALGADEG